VKSINNSLDFAREIRRLSIKMVYQAKASHIGGALSMADLLAVLYFDYLNINPKEPSHAKRDRFLLSKGHSCTSLYATLALKGFFPVNDLNNFAQDGSLLLSHASHLIPGVEISSGSLGHALPISCGIAIALKNKHISNYVFCLLSDGELDEGSNWESILFAPHHRLDNLILIVDYNKIQSFGSVDEVLQLAPLKEKFFAFNWETFEVDGHNHVELKNVFSMVQKKNEKPKVINKA
jgi:transketolase